MGKLDQYDEHILRELQKDSSISNLELSKKIGLSPSACLVRTKNLREEGYIKQFATLVDEEKVGMKVQAFVLVNLTPLTRENFDLFLENIHSYPQVQECYTITGNKDFMLKIIAADMDEYRNFIINTLLQNKNISSIETNIVMRTDKRKIYVPINGQ
ncbi:MAG: Lrp/AsnC family transcriptional regulator [Tissierellia bacterium]|nr:Lrp/AsnC family transcriptional regulator [Tissierellia bacterium]